MTHDDLVKLLEALSENILNNTKATYLLRRELQTHTHKLEEYMNLIREITPTY